MPVKSAPYYWLECDGCGERAEYNEFSAFNDVGQAIDRAEEWTRSGSGDTEVFHCPACPPLDVEDREADDPRPCNRRNAHTNHGACPGTAPEFPWEAVEEVTA